jgi:hypothetical protein
LPWWLTATWSRLGEISSAGCGKSLAVAELDRRPWKDGETRWLRAICTRARPLSQPLPGREPWRDWERGDQEVEHGPEVMEYVVLVWAHRWMVVATLALVVLAAGLWTVTRPKLFRSMAKVAVQPSPQLSQNTVEAYLNYWEMDRFILDQVEVLQTRQLAQRVVDKLGLESQPELGQDRRRCCWAP